MAAALDRGAARRGGPLTLILWPPANWSDLLARCPRSGGVLRQGQFGCPPGGSGL